MQGGELIAGFRERDVRSYSLLPAGDALGNVLHHRAHFVEQIHRDLGGFGFDFPARGLFETGLQIMQPRVRILIAEERNRAAHQTPDAEPARELVL